MKPLSTLFCVVAMGLAGGIGAAQVGAPLPDVPFTDFAQTEASTIDDFKGRLILLEVFAYW